MDVVPQEHCQYESEQMTAWIYTPAIVLYCRSSLYNSVPQEHCQNESEQMKA